MAGVQAVPALGDDEHGHYDADDFSSLTTDSATTDSTLPLSDEHFRLEKEYEAQIEQDVNAPRGTLSERARADPMSPGFASMMDVTCAMFERMNMRLFSSAGRF